MTVAFLDEFRSPMPTCKRCGNHERLREVRVSGKAETLCQTCRTVLDCEPVWVEFGTRPQVNDNAFWSE